MKGGLLILGIACATLLWVGVVEADEPRVTVDAPREQVTLGKAFPIHIEVTVPGGATVNLATSLPLEDVDELGRTATKKLLADGTERWKFTLTLMAFDVGDLEIPELPVTYAIDGTATTLKTAPATLVVVSSIGDGGEELRDIVEPVPVSRRDWTLVVVLSIIFGLVLAWFVARLVLRLLSGRERAVSSAATPAEPLVPADIEAFSRFDALEASGALESADLKPAYHELSEILRVYVGRRYDFPALDLTTTEIEEALRDSRDLDADSYAALVRWLRATDLVKFADAAAEQPEATAALAEARELVKATTPAPAERATEVEL